MIRLKTGVTPEKIITEITQASVRVDSQILLDDQESCDAVHAWSPNAASLTSALEIPVERVVPENRFPCEFVVDPDTVPSPPGARGGDDDEKLLALLVLLILLIPILFYIWVKCRYGEQSGDYFAYKFSHNNPYIVVLYMPKERSEDLKNKLFKKDPPVQPSTGGGTPPIKEADEAKEWQAEAPGPSHVDAKSPPETYSEAPGPSNAPGPSEAPISGVKSMYNAMFGSSPPAAACETKAPIERI